MFTFLELMRIKVSKKSNTVKNVVSSLNERRLFFKDSEKHLFGKNVFYLLSEGLFYVFLAVYYTAMYSLELVKWKFIWNNNSQRWYIYIYRTHKDGIYIYTELTKIVYLYTEKGLILSWVLFERIKNEALKIYCLCNSLCTFANVLTIKRPNRDS